MLDRDNIYSRLAEPIEPDDHIEGNPQAPLKIVEYGDYECPFCRRAYLQMKPVIAEAGDRLGYVFRNFPLTQVHPHAENAAEAAEIAGRYGRFWEMHGMLFENQDALDDGSLIRYAVALGISADEFADQLASHVMAPRVRADFMSGLRSGVSGTPTFFINGDRFEGSSDDLVTLLLS
jgi:protein-disulfide isomerase